MPDRLRPYEASEFRTFLATVDGYLNTSVKFVVLGGCAASLYGVESVTRDIDTFETDLSGIQVALSAARADTGLYVPVTGTPVADVPYNYEDRLRRQLPELTRLQVYTLEPHDLALSKIVRGQEGDFVTIEALHRLIPFDLQTLVTRYLDEMSHAATDIRSMDISFVALIRDLFGELRSEQIEHRIAKRRSKSRSHR